MTARPVLLTPQRDEPGVYPYRRVWRTAYLEALLLIGATLAVVLVNRIAPFPLDDEAKRAFRIVFAILPAALWVLISLAAERRARRPRGRLSVAFVLGGLVASGIAVPVIDRLFTTENWLPTADGLTRLVGYTLTVGMLQEFLKYAALRYSFWPRHFDQRLDGVAYSLAVAVGYATAINLYYASGVGNAEPTAAALRIAENTLTQVAVSVIMGLALAELARPNAPIYFAPLSMLLAAALAGFAIVIRGGAVVGGLSEGSDANNAIFGLGVGVVFLVFLFASMAFLIDSADERDRLQGRAER
ncbi:MAG: PrsW family intramembrane metalloprotease [Anaerolineae bacterium]|nr:PrsW family intramembrane metalloprotease [Anaerolineae bacterium]